MYHVHMFSDTIPIRHDPRHYTVPRLRIRNYDVTAGDWSLEEGEPLHQGAERAHVGIHLLALVEEERVERAPEQLAS